MNRRIAGAAAWAALHARYGACTFTGRYVPYIVPPFVGGFTRAEAVAHLAATFETSPEHATSIFRNLYRRHLLGSTKPHSRVFWLRGGTLRPM